MISIKFEVEFDNDEALEGGDPPPPRDPGTKLFEALTEWWVRNTADPYVNLSIHEKLDPITIPWSFLENESSFEVTFDFDLLENLLEIYAALGWGALEKIESTLTSLPDAFRQTKEFFRVTRNVVAVMVAQGLVELEQQTVTYAQQKWAAAREQLLEYLKAFKIIKYNVEHPRIANRKLADELFQLCRDYGVEAWEARRLQEEIEVRNRKDPPKSRQKGSGAELWFEAFAAPQREALNKMADYLTCIAEKFPAAALVLDELPDSVFSASSPYQRLLAQIDLENKIYSTLEFLVSGLQALEESLKLSGPTLELAEFIKPMIADPSDFSQLGRLSVPSGGFEQTVIDTTFRTEKVHSAGQVYFVEKLEVHRLFADLDLLFSFYDDPKGIEPGTWAQVVLYQYCVRLTETVEAKKQDTKFWEVFWGWIGRVTAFLGLVGLMAIFPFGEAAVGPALASLLTLAGSFSVILVVLTLLHDVFDTLQKDGKLEADARDKFFRLAQNDPDAIFEIGAILSHSKALRDGLTKGFFFTVLTLGAGRVLKPVAAALNFQVFFQDVETLFAPAEADG